jgi:hypothetical protein
VVEITDWVGAIGTELTVLQHYYFPHKLNYSLGRMGSSHARDPDLASNLAEA